MSTYVNDKTSDGVGYVKRHLRYNDYVEKGTTVEGYWMGKACEAFGVEAGSVVQEKEFARLEDNKHAMTGEKLTVRHNERPREKSYIDKQGNLATMLVKGRKPFADINTGAPKTASVGAIVFKSELIREAERRAYAKLFLEIEAITGRQANNGKQHVVLTGNLCAAVYEHTSNRCLEPQLHRHLIAINATHDASTGQNYAVEFGEQSQQSRYLTAVYWDALAAEYSAIGAEWEIDEHGAPQLLALKEHAEICSRRTKEIEALIERIELYAGTKLSNSEAKAITLASRGLRVKEFEKLWEQNKAQLDGLKTLDPDKAEKARRAILSRFTAMVSRCSDPTLDCTTTEKVESQRMALFSEDQIARGFAFASALQRRETLDRSRDIEVDIKYAIEHVFASKSVVKEHELYQAVLLHAQGKDVDLSHMKKLLHKDQKLVWGRGREVGPTEHYRMELENELWIEQGKGKGIAIDSRGLSEQLNDSQRNAVVQTLRCADSVAMLRGKPGVGKTYSAAEIARKNIEAGHGVMVLAPESGARDVLREYATKLSGPTANAFRGAENVDEFLVNTKLQKRLGPQDLVIVDEAAMSSLRRVNALQALARRQGLRVLMMGDDRQLNSVEYGDAFRLIREHSTVQVANMDQIVRQDPEALDGAYLRACQCLSEGQTAEGMWELYQAGVIKEMKGQARVDYYADLVMRSLSGEDVSVSSNISHRENDQIAEVVRARLKEAGKLTDERMFLAHRTLGYSPAQKQEVAKFEPGMIIQITRGQDKGRAWKILSVAGGKALTEDPTGSRRTFDKRHAGMIDICTQREFPVAIGDILRANSGGEGIINGQLFEVEGFQNGNPLSKGREIAIRNLSYAYPSTVRKVQGATEQKAVFGLDRRSIRAATKEIVNVACTRGRRNIEILVESLADLSQIEHRSSRRKGVSEMAIPEETLPKDLRKLRAAIEQCRGEASADKTRANAELTVERDPEKEHTPKVDLQAGVARRGGQEKEMDMGEEDLEMINAAFYEAAAHQNHHEMERGFER
jgi:conjugative relaxase-like TrwC/TraI family protein